jgi:hypothetical protein
MDAASEERQRRIMAFNRGGSHGAHNSAADAAVADVFLLSTRAGGLGINLATVGSSTYGLSTYGSFIYGSSASGPSTYDSFIYGSSLYGIIGCYRACDHFGARWYLPGFDI